MCHKRGVAANFVGQPVAKITWHVGAVKRRAPRLQLLVTQGGHGVEAAGAEGGDVAGGAGYEGESGGGEAQR